MQNDLISGALLTAKCNKSKKSKNHADIRKEIKKNKKIALKIGKGVTVKSLPAFSDTVN